MSGGSSTCLVRGSINIDEFFHLPHIVRPGETISSLKLTRGSGGKGANQANAVARAGGRVLLDGCIGEDGIWVKDGLEKNGVDVSRVIVTKEEVTGRAIIQSSADGENSIVLHKGANYHIPPTDNSPPLKSITHLLLQNEIPLTSTITYLKSASSSGVISIFNPSPMLTPSELRSFPWECLSWLIVNEGELQDLLEALQIPLDTSSGGAAGSGDLHERAEAKLRILNKDERFRKCGLICTLGSKGVMYLHNSKSEGGEVIVKSLPAGKVINGVKDTTGAGDCFTGYFAAGVMRGEELDEVFKTCLTACAMCVEKPGAMESVPTRDEVLARMGV